MSESDDAMSKSCSAHIKGLQEQSQQSDPRPDAEGLRLQSYRTMHDDEHYDEAPRQACNPPSATIAQPTYS